jgi:hypothetical protein
MYTILNQFPCDLGGRPANNVPNFILHGVSTGEELPPLHNLDKVLPSVDMRFMPTDVNSTCNQFCLLLRAVLIGISQSTTASDVTLDVRILTGH